LALHFAACCTARVTLLTTLPMAGADIRNISSKDSFLFEELLSLKARLATQMSASPETHCSVDSNTLFRCAKLRALHGNAMAKDMAEVVIDGDVAFIKRPGLTGDLHVPKLPGNKPRCGWTQHMSRCEPRHAGQGDSSSDDDDIHALQELRMKLAIRLAETSHLRQPFPWTDCLVAH